MGRVTAGRRSGTHAAAAVSAFVLASCTRILGIDGQYVTGSGGATGADGGASGSLADGGDGAGGAGGASGGTDSTGDGGMGAGGLTAEGGETSSGGTADVGAGGDVNDAGLLSASAGGVGDGGAAGGSGTGGVTATCQPGTYKGTFAGKHYPLTGGMFVPVDLSGTVTLHVGDADAGTTGLSIAFAPTTTNPNAIQALAAALSFDCAANAGSGTFGKPATVRTTIPPDYADIQGELHGSFTSPTVLKGTWKETEVLVPTAAGVGTWTATWSGP